jgi:adenylate cyclase, class 2
VSVPDAIESELKIPVDDLHRLRSIVAELGAQRRHEMRREHNVVVDTADGTLAARGRLLRLRTVGEHHLLTLKGPASFRGRIKERTELEIEIGSCEVMLTVFAELGVAPVVRYEKDREEWLLRGVVVCLDHTPMGEFVELEGEPERLAEVASALLLDPARAVTSSYLGLWREHRRRHPELRLPPDMVFPP